MGKQCSGPIWAIWEKISKVQGASDALTKSKSSEAPDILEAELNKDTTEGTQEGTCKEQSGAEPKLRWVQGCVVTQANKRLDAKFEAGW